MLRTFAAVAQSGNLADAGLRLGRTQSAVSMTLKQLEERLGAKLFESERKNRLTILGEEVFELAQQQLRQFDDTVTTIETMASAPQGILRIASVPSVVNLALPTAIETLNRRNPTIKIELRDTDSDRIIDALLHGQADIGIVSGQPSLNGIHQEVLFEDAFGLVCSRNHPIAQRTTSPTFDDLMSPDFIRNNLCNLIQTPKLRAPLEAAQLTVYNTLSLMAMLRAGRWITVLPQSVVGIMPDQISFRKIDGLNEKRTVSLLVRERCLFPDLARELSDILKSSNQPGTRTDG